MKLPSLCLALLLTASAALAADSDGTPAPAASTGKPTLHGLIASGDSLRFLLTTPGEGSGQWYSVGDSVGDWKLASYSDKDGVLVLHREGGPDAELTLFRDHAAAAAPEEHATLAQAQALLQKMNFAQMMKRVMEQQKQAMATISRQALVQRGLSGEALDQALAQQAKVMDTVWSAIDSGSMQDDIAQVYSQVFTPSELGALSDFYSTSAGQAMLEKMPQVQQKTMQIIMPKIMQAAAAARQAAQAQAQGAAAPQP